MAIIKWRDSYNTGINNVDEEHKKLVALIENMHCVIRDKGGKEEIENVLNRVVEYTQSHFANEEKMMQELQYDKFPDHKIEHEKLVKDVGVFKEKLLSNFPEGSHEFYHFLREWLIDHILDSDKAFGNFYSANQT